MSAKEAIKNLELTSAALSKAANKPENYNTDWEFYLKQMSWSLHKRANELKEIQSSIDTPEFN